MPCRDDYNGPNSIDELRVKIDELTQNLCFMCGTVEGDELWEHFDNKRIKDWWKKHQENDTKRVTKAIAEYVLEHPRTSPRVIADKFIRFAEMEHPVSEFHKHWFHAIAQQEVDAHLTKQNVIKTMTRTIKSKLTKDELKFAQNYMELS